ncbi:MAG TPA: hypothetical protein VMR18_03315 [Candidatus Saccharimonadales bacterium]|jgi:hypothetical protein|nr:hypothetical protein [Candidatus Saccharimonadales bacterium]
MLALAITVISGVGLLLSDSFAIVLGISNLVTFIRFSHNDAVQQIETERQRLLKVDKKKLSEEFSNQ